MKTKKPLPFLYNLLHAATAQCLRTSVLLLLLFSNWTYAQIATEQLKDAAQTYLEHAVSEYLSNGQIQGRSEIVVGQLDPRLRLPACDQALQVSLESPATPLGRVTTRVRCNGSSPWTVFVPAQVRLFREVLVASRPLARNSQLSHNDFFLAERDVGQLKHGYLTEPEQALGLKTTRAVQTDQVILASFLEQQDLVRKGDQVVITAQTPSVNVRMPGEALSSGALGEQINVRNLRSQRIIRARITGAGQVEVSL